MPKIKKFRILLIGFGSIGKRHYQNLLSLGYKNISVYDPSDNAFAGFANIKRIISLTRKNIADYKIAFICNPNSLHIQTAIKCAESGCHLFIEKPLGHTLEGVARLKKICREKKLINFVACNVRFHPALVFIKNYLQQKKLGKVYLMHLQTGLYLPFWRPKQDYRKNFSAKKAGGGGIILDGGIHNFDLLFWLNDFASVKDFSLIRNKVSDLEIETEDCFVASFNFKNKIQASIGGDYLQKPYSWIIKIVGEKANLEWDFKENIIWRIDEKGKKILKQIKNWNTNDMYISEFRYFMGSVSANKKTFNDVSRAAGVLKYCLTKKQ